MAATALLAPATACTRRVQAPFSSSLRIVALPRAAARQPAAAWRSSLLPSQRAVVCQAADNDKSEAQQAAQQADAAAPSSSSSEAPAAPRRQAVPDASVAKGQRTAIVTGAISIIFGIIYLALVFFLDMRGGEMLPPPPEAFEYM